MHARTLLGGSLERCGVSRQIVDVVLTDFPGIAETEEHGMRSRNSSQMKRDFRGA